ncbi:dihydroorotase [Secundilactobacillus paracollinoides]|uniref:Dihydroorotase n=1 Tax=Secundilactobacillus paracollinoides TaxID=240427 RepID=A0A1B2IYZ1_9LACO|nr:dihydroorotase [Secundilactobacillus paracollinoides]ANZ61318.1 dihydroorotase [Secundilactobacillus paracollinoides]ANZ67239.1 dihydroorotase [Secundilactobacillus paracollinoides]
MKRLIKNGQLLINGQLKTQDILVENDKIAATGSLDDAQVNADAVFDATGLFVSPGLVDVHVHYREPGQTDKETIKTGSLAAAHGGFTTVAAMPNVIPTPDTPERITTQIAKNQQDGAVHIVQYATITTDRGGDELVDFKGLKVAGAFAFSNDGNGVQTSETMYEAMKQAAALDMAVVAHAEDDSLTHGGVMHEGAASQRLGLPGIPSVSETAQVARDVVLAQATGVHYHVSSAATIQVVRAAKQAGVHVTAEVSPHHLLLSDDQITTDNAMLKMNPPLGSDTDRQALIQGLLDGTIDMIATDHAPHTDAEKAQSMLQAPFGITGSETAFQELYTKFVKPGTFSLAQLVNWMAVQPAKVFGLQQAGSLTVGQPADIAVFELTTPYEIQAADFLSMGHNSPFVGDTVYGGTQLTLVDGQIAYQR